MNFINLSGIWPPLERAVMLYAWRHIARRARDCTVEMTRRDCLVLAPHPDDETLGCGGLTMRKRAAGQPVHVVVATDGAASGAANTASAISRDELTALRERETIAACARLGVTGSHVRFLRFPDGRLAAHGAALETRIAALVKELAPSEVYVCARSDGHRDHVALAQAVRALHAQGRLGGAAVWEYPVWFWDFRSWRPEGVSNKVGFIEGLRKIGRSARSLNAVAVKLDGLEQRKRGALSCHRSQVGGLEDELGWSGLPGPFLEFFFRDRELFFEVGGAQGGTSGP